jgi:uncharacterized membrane protein (UPF0127 family)
MNARVGRLFLTALTAIVILAGAFAFSQQFFHLRTQPSVEIAGQTIHVSIADTAPLREKGLGDRDHLNPDEGMLFVFQTDDRYAFWMKDMRFSIDIVWLTASGTIIYVADNVAPETYPHAFLPDEPARYVLELPAGWMSSHDVKIGDIVRL